MSTEPGPRNLPDYWDRNHREPYSRTRLPALDESVARRLSLVERATVRVAALTPEAVPPGRSVLLEAAYRLALFRLRGDLPYMSGTRLAEYLETVFWGSHPSPYAVRGWELLAAMDRSGYGEVWLHAEPSLTAPYRFRPMRLHQRVAELEGCRLTPA